MGAVAGALLGATTAGDDDFIVSQGTATAGAAVALGAAGALLGLATSHGERWETKTLNGLPLTFVAPRGGGAALRVAIRF